MGSLRTREATIPELTRTLTGLGCVVVVAPPEQHPMLKALLHPAVDTLTIGPVVLFSSREDLERHHAQLVAAVDLLLAESPDDQEA